MGKECAAFVCKEYPNDGYLKLVALRVKLRGIEWSKMGSMEEQKCAADDVLSAVDEFFRGEESIPAFALNTKYDAHFTLGRIAADSNDPADAIKHYSRAEECLCSLGRDENDFEMMQLRMMIAKALCAQRGEDAAAINTTVLPFIRAMFEKSKEEYGEDYHDTLITGNNVAYILCELKQFNEAEKLFLDLHTKAHRVFGAHHEMTKKINILMSKYGISD